MSKQALIEILERILTHRYDIPKEHTGSTYLSLLTGLMGEDAEKALEIIKQSESPVVDLAALKTALDFLDQGFTQWPAEKQLFLDAARAYYQEHTQNLIEIPVDKGDFKKVAESFRNMYLKAARERDALEIQLEQVRSHLSEPEHESSREQELRHLFTRAMGILERAEIKPEDILGRDALRGGLKKISDKIVK